MHKFFGFIACYLILLLSFGLFFTFRFFDTVKPANYKSITEQSVTDYRGFSFLSFATSFPFFFFVLIVLPSFAIADKVGIRCATGSCLLPGGRGRGWATLVQVIMIDECN